MSFKLGQIVSDNDSFLSEDENQSSKVLMN